MKPRSFLAALLLLLLLLTSAFALTQENESDAILRSLDGTELNRQLAEREEKIKQLPAEEQTKLRDAQESALQDFAVRAALQKRNQANLEFQRVLQASMLKSDPALEVILRKMEAGVNRGF